MNKVILLGRLTRDVNVRKLPSGNAVSEFSIAYNRIYRKGEDTKQEVHYFDLIAYRDLSERVKKGDLVLIEGRLSQERWEDKEGKSKSRVRIVVESIRRVRAREEGLEEERVDGTSEIDF
ncbi:MAG: single-stranded DNA-binding protein [Desulfurococcaceae archaeon]